MYNIVQERIKGTHRIELSNESNVGIKRMLEIVLTADLQWGAKVEEKDGVIVLSTKVFGDTDITSVKPNNEVADDFIRLLIRTYDANGTSGVHAMLYQYMGIKGYDPNLIYSTDDLIEVANYYFSGEDVSEFGPIIKSQKPKPRKLDFGNMEYVHDLKKELALDANDGVLKVLSRAAVVFDK